MASKLSYSEKLKHPFWQRKRLSVLEASEFKCATCAATEKTLHVHHKHYVKGREPWEYEDNELEALCEDCHSEAHEARETLNAVLAQYPTEQLHELTSLLVGFGGDQVDSAMWLLGSELHCRAGRFARFIADHMVEEEAFRLLGLMEEVGPWRSLDALKAESEK